MATPAFSPGFRLSKLDVAVLVLGAIGSLVIGSIVWWIGFVIAFVIAHFFLFCNVFRLSRPLELIWAAIFVALAAGTVATDFPGWPITAGGSLVATAVVVALELRKPSYHGLGWEWVNPSLSQWWEEEQTASDDP